MAAAMSLRADSSCSLLSALLHILLVAGVADGSLDRGIGGPHWLLCSHLQVGPDCMLAVRLAHFTHCQVEHLKAEPCYFQVLWHVHGSAALTHCDATVQVQPA